jgi:hypothetical protein
MDEQTRFNKIGGGIYDVTIKLTACYDYGCLHFRVSVGDQCVDMRACNTTDPFPDFIAWLEAITVGVENCAFIIDEEGTDKQFDYSRRCGQEESIFIIKEPYEGEELLVAPVKTKQMVKALYEGIGKVTELQIVFLTRNSFQILKPIYLHTCSLLPSGN